MAVTDTVPASIGTVSTPPALMFPTLDDHATAELYAPVPSTEATQLDVPPPATLEGEQRTATDVTVGWDD